MSTSHHDHADLPPPRVEEVSDGLFAYIQPDGSWFINNTGFLVGRDLVVSIDTCSTERRTRDYLAAVESVAGRAPRTLVTTHHHADHTNGNYLLPCATIIGHERCREEVLKMGIVRPEGMFEPVVWGDLELAAPFVTIEERACVHVDDLRVELLHLASAAHTTNDLVAWVPERRVLYAGDLIFNGGTPFVLMGSVAGSLEALDRIMELEPDVIVPGHGAVCGIEQVDACGRYLRWLQTIAPELKGAGLSPLEGAREVDLGPYAELLDAERLPGNLHRAYAELDGAAPGADIDVMTAFADMIAFNGGRPLRCLA